MRLFPLFLLPCLMPLPTTSCLGTSTCIILTGVAPELHPIVLPSCFCHSKSYTTSPYCYPQRLSPSKGTAERVR
jgi:hypothetical protein